jgi:hypothetical protein
MNETQRCQSLLLPELRMVLLWFIEGATSPSMTLTELSRASMLTIALQERRKVEEAYVQGLQKLARRPQQDGAAALGCV